MKTAKRKLYLTLAAIGLIVLQCTMSVHALGLVQSEESVSTTLYHEHTQADCWSRKWVPCGGWWSSYFEEYVGATVYVCTNGNSKETSNGVVLSNIHHGWEYKAHTGLHDGEYVSQMICDQTVAGTFTVTKVLSENGDTAEEREAAKGSAEASMPAELVASVTSQGTGISDVSFCWRCPDQSVVAGERITISQNGVYCAMLDWRDSKTGVYHTATLDYVEISNPVLLIFQSGDEVLEEIEVSYGGSLPDIEIPAKEGYDFKGYYSGLISGEENADAAAWYDGKGNPDRSVTITGSALQETLTAKWEARSYHVFYGEDENGDGTGDCELYVTYGEEYGPAQVDGEERGGYIFDGYYLGKEQVFDADGLATGVWRWDAEGDIILSAVYHKKPNPSSGYTDHGDAEGNGEKEDGDSETALSGSVSGNSISENSISENGISGNNISENGVSGDGMSGNDSIGGHPESGREHSDGGTDGGRQEGREDENRRPFYERISVDHDGGISDAASEVSTVTQETVSNRISENMASGRMTETGLLRGKSAVVRTLEVTGITAGILGLAYLTVWMVITKASFAEIFSFRADESKRRLGAVLILHGENAFHIHIKERMLEKGETGKYQLIFRKRFSLKHANQDIIIHCRKKEIPEVIRPDVVFFIE